MTAIEKTKLPLEELLQVYALLLDPLKKAKRLSNLSDATRESVAAHTFSACMLAMLLADDMCWDDRTLLKILKGLLTHDLCEAYGGDVPNTLVDKYPVMRNLKLTQERKFKFLAPTSAYRQIMEPFYESDSEERVIKNYIDLCDRLDWILQQLSIEYAVPPPQLSVKWLSDIKNACDKTDLDCLELIKKVNLDKFEPPVSQDRPQLPSANWEDSVIL